MVGFSCPRALAGASLCFALLASANPRAGKPIGNNPNYRGHDPCPAHCSATGSDASNWSVYRSLDQLGGCHQGIFIDVSIHDEIDDPTTLHRLRACTVWGSDWDNLPTADARETATEVNATYQLGWWKNPSSDAETGSVADAASLASQMRTYFSQGHGLTTQSALVLGKYRNASIGVYLGRGLQNTGMGEVALGMFSAGLSTAAASGEMAMQVCEPGRDADHTFGVITTANGTFSAVQSALRSWSKAECLGGFSGTNDFTAPIFVTMPPLHPVLNTTDFGGFVGNNGTNSSATLAPRNWLGRRADCRTISVAAGDGCASLAVKCGVSGNAFMGYNTKANFCATLQPGQRVCCSSGTLPDFTPKPNPDGSCATYTSVAEDNCHSIAAANSITVTRLEDLNKKTWGWNGCDNLWVGVRMCLSTGTAPMPASIWNAVCGPQKLGTQKPADGVDIATLNPCLLKACCNVWGQCGTTSEFCTDTNTGPPGTALKGTNGCISNCGTTIVRGEPAAVYRSIAYFEGFNLGRSCLNMDITQLDTSKYTHVHFAFAVLTEDFQVSLGDVQTTFQFEYFKTLRGVKRILSFGGWTFSNDKSTYHIFRNGVTPANRLTMATNIANFIRVHDLDGVDIDWEYPGGTGLPELEKGDPIEGSHYLGFLVILKNLLRDKSVSIAAPASYWYLKVFPIETIGMIVDYIVYMTYDMHGQWDYNNQWANPGCPKGNCLRSPVNLTETIGALVMITKAGVPSNKVVVGVTSYARSFKMTTPGCSGEMCTFTGPDSGALPGPCTDTAGYISDAEINQILASDRVNRNFIDAKSHSNMLVYDNDQWASWMDPTIKATRSVMYKALNMGGITDWAIDLQGFMDPPIAEGWDAFKLTVSAGGDPFILGERTGNWTTLECTDPGVVGDLTFTPEARWSMLDCDSAWNDALDVWRKHHWNKKGAPTFTASIWDTFHGAPGANCQLLVAASNCDQTGECFAHKGSGPAAHLVMNALVSVHQAYKNLYTALFQVSGLLFAGFDAFEDDFAPLPDPQDQLAFNILMNMLGVGAVMVTAPVFNQYLRSTAYWAKRPDKLDNLKDSMLAFEAGIITSVKDVNADNPSLKDWTEEKRDQFTAYMSQVVFVWGEAMELAVDKLFDGSPESIQSLTTLISDELQTLLTRVFYSYTIPAIWTAAGLSVFVMDSGYTCNHIDPVTPEYMDADTAHATSTCYNNKLYYLVRAIEGPAEECDQGGCGDVGCVPWWPCTKEKFQVPPGLDKLGSPRYGKVTAHELIVGAIKTFEGNGHKNGAGPAKITNKPTLEDIMNTDTTTPGYVRIPVCSPAEAYGNWLDEDKAANRYHGFPCNKVE